MERAVSPVRRPSPWDPIPEPMKPYVHPAPALVATLGEYVTAAKVRGWGTLRKRLAPGWRMTETRAVGWQIGPKGLSTGALVESLVLRFGRYVDDALVARAVACLVRQLDEATREPLEPWAHDVSYAWTPGEFPTQLGARELVAHLTTEPEEPS